MNALDNIPLALVFLASIVSQILFIELGYRMATVKAGKPNKSQMAQVRAIMGASLGLLAFMLAFSFNTAQKHFEERTASYMMEVSAIDSAYRGADLILKDEREAAKKLLTDFAKLRIETAASVQHNEIDAAIEMIRESEHIHDQLWALAERSMEEGGDGEDTSIFAQAVLAMIDAHDARLQNAFFNRVPPIIWFTLYGMALLSMAIMGYQAGLTGTRSSFATWTLAITFAFVMVLITDLDRPRMTLFKQNQQLMVEMQNRMTGGHNWDPVVHEGQ